MKNGFSKSLIGDDTVQVSPKSTPRLSMITLRFVTLLSGIVVLLTWSWSR